MTPLSEQEVEDLLGAYALGALAGSDLQRVEDHLATCDRHARVAADLQRVTPALGLSVEDRDPSPELKARVLKALESPGRIACPRPQLPRQVMAAAAALVLLAAGIGIGRLSAPQSAPTQVTTWTFRGNAQAPGALARLVYFNRDHRAVVQITGLKPLSAGQVYEMWLFRGASPVDSGVAQAPGGTLVAQLGDLSNYSQFAVTIEPGEQSQPTSNPILIGKLGSSGATP
jgi:anti-sigma-K factor RskA